jgi:DNA mismatch repair protein MLH1
LVCRNKNNRVGLNSNTIVPQESDQDSKGKESCSYHASGFVSHPSNQATTQATLVLFVNDRLVESTPLKRILQDMGSTMIIYLSIKVPGTQVDVNVHPTKKQVTLLYQEEVFDGVESRERTALRV